MKVFHRSRANNCGKLRFELGRRNRFDALASTHHLRYVREERATPLLRLFPPVRETSRAECRAAGCALFPNEYSDVVWFRQPDSTIRLSPRQGPACAIEDRIGDDHV